MSLFLGRGHLGIARVGLHILGEVILLAVVALAAADRMDACEE